MESTREEKLKAVMDLQKLLVAPFDIHLGYSV